MHMPAAGEREKAKDAIGELRALAEKRYVSAVNVATLYARLGDADATFAWLGKAFEARDSEVQQLVGPVVRSIPQRSAVRETERSNRFALVSGRPLSAGRQHQTTDPADRSCAPDRLQPVYCWRMAV
jgi:hypothetical protein